MALAAEPVDERGMPGGDAVQHIADVHTGNRSRRTAQRFAVSRRRER
ncbi:MAG: hypothetical protein U1F39_13080 [Steroidobacteraceae bacterium]